MKIAVSSQNFRTVTGHAGKTRRFLVFEATAGGELQPLEPIDLPREMSMHEFIGGEHPLDAMDIVITASAGEGFIRKLTSRGVGVVVTGETDPRQAVENCLAGKVKPAEPHVHSHAH